MVTEKLSEGIPLIEINANGFCNARFYFRNSHDGKRNIRLFPIFKALNRSIISAWSASFGRSKIEIMLLSSK